MHGMANIATVVYTPSLVQLVFPDRAGELIAAARVSTVVLSVALAPSSLLQLISVGLS
jgi:hypothetical protein